MSVNVDKYVAFTVVNFFTASFIMLIVCMIFASLKFFVCSLISILIVVVLQYPALNRCKGWLSRSVVFFLSMNVFLFILGVVASLTLGISLDNVDAGLKMIYIGNVFGVFFAGIGPIGYLLILLVNISLRKHFFD
ncbi:hypothetical protein CI789_06615 [Erwinia persicina]|uniref:hypothetical protein n=1 Tax=Erwinia persicina TaxID=55211 RepID=UPI0007878B70|nr:hypothetical protein [Erwinia persicina]AXU94925.1 hypothetical protein CI789_06615 [Erwinia persicina]MBC3943761.1 hypothetical protein [Erwinia persicina]MBD8167014.1 hypothetical protein [Erwinia persicina]MCQ4095634.1 hypothetical protein [Erwinia persicina]MCQ4102007.1 hypothetical protein [Erwinia persicina]